MPRDATSRYERSEFLYAVALAVEQRHQEFENSLLDNKGENVLQSYYKLEGLWSYLKGELREDAKRT